MTASWDSNITIPACARKIDEVSQPGSVSFARLPEDANQIYFSILADKSTYCGSVHILDVSPGSKPRVRITVSDSDGTPPPAAGFVGRLFGGKPKYQSRPAIVEKAVEVLKGALPPT